MSLNSLSEHCGLNIETLYKIWDVFKQYPALEKAILYGSRAKGTYRQGSDIDLTLLGKELDYSQLAKIENQLDNLLLAYSFDLSLFKEMTDENLIEHIHRVGMVFYPVEG